MKAPWFVACLMVWGVAVAADRAGIDIPGFSVTPLSTPGGEEWWIPSTKPLEMTRYALTNDTVRRPPIAVTVLHYASPQQAKAAFQMSGRGRPQAPKELEVLHWDAAHRWPTDLFLLKGHYAVGLYNLPPEFSAEQTQRLLDAVAAYIVKAEQKSGAANRSQPTGSETNRPSSAHGPGA